MANEPYRLTQTGAEVQADLNDIEALGLATEETAGKMSAADKTKLDGIESGAEANVIETVKVNGAALTPDANKAVDIDTKRVLVLKGIPESGNYTTAQFENAVCAISDLEKAVAAGFTFVKVPMADNSLGGPSFAHDDYYPLSFIGTMMTEGTIILFATESGIYKIEVGVMHAIGQADLYQVSTTFTAFPTSSQMSGWTAKYDKPSGGIPATDLASGVIPTALSELSEDTTHRTVTDSEKNAWNETNIIHASVLAFPAAFSNYTREQALAAFGVTNEQFGLIIASVGVYRTLMGGATMAFTNGVFIQSWDANGITFRRLTFSTIGSEVVYSFSGPLYLANVQSDWNEDDSTKPSFIKHKPDLNMKADKVSSPTAGNFAGLDSYGNPTDSGKKASDFATAAQGTKADTAYQKPQTGIPASDIASGVIPAPEVFWYDPQTHQFSELVAACNAGKLVAYNDAGTVYLLYEYDGLGLTAFFVSFFLGVNDEPGVKVFSIDEEGVTDNYSGILPTSLSQLTDDSTHRLVTDAEKTAWNGKYTKPSGGIPASDIAAGVIPDVSGKENTLNKVTSLSSQSTDTQYPSAKATYDAINPSVQSSQPAGGFAPNEVYDLGTLTGSVTFALAAGVTGKVNAYHWTFDTGSTAPTITWPANITWAGGSAPTINASKHYEIFVRNGYATFIEF